MNPDVQHVQEDNAAPVKPGLPNAHVTGGSALQPNTPRPPLSAISMQELNQVDPLVPATSETSLVPTSSSVTIVGDTVDSGSTFEQGFHLSPPSDTDGHEDDVPSDTGVSTQVHHETELEVILQAPTLGRLFTDGEHEELLIEVLHHLPLNDKAKCFRICRNTNTVMVESSQIQIMLRRHLYGYESLFVPFWAVKLGRRPLKDPDAGTLKNAIALFCRTQEVIEHGTYKSKSPEPSDFPCDFEDIQGRRMLLSRARDWQLLKMPESRTPWNVRDSPDSEFALGAEDKVVVETIGELDVDHQVIVVRPYGINTSGPNTLEPNHTSTKHPGAKREEITIVFLIASSVRSSINHVPIRLYRGGYGAVLLTEVHSCDIDLPVQETTRLVVYNWKRDIGVGKIKIPDCTVKILDFRFLSEIHFACSSIRKVNGSIYPCIDIYLILPHHDKYPVEDHEGLPQGLLIARTLPNLVHVASFQFPPLENPQQSCLWTTPTPSFSRLIEFAIRVPRPVGTAGYNDHAMTFRLEGQAEGKSEALEGVILVSRLFDLIREGRFVNGSSDSREADRQRAQDPSSTPAATAAEQLEAKLREYNDLCFKWDEWSSSVSLQHSTSSTVLEPRNTQVASIARSPIDESRAIMVIRDYNQRMLLAPPGHLDRNLGHPTNNCDPSDRQERQRTGDDTFTTVTETQIVKSILFGKDVEYGLGHRVRTMDLGVYPHDTSTSRLFWSEEYMQIVDSTPGQDGFLLHVYEPVDDNLKYVKKTKAAPAETKAEGGGVDKS